MANVKMYRVRGRRMVGCEKWWAAQRLHSRHAELLSNHYQWPTLNQMFRQLYERCLAEISLDFKPSIWLLTFGQPFIRHDGGTR